MIEKVSYHFRLPQRGDVVVVNRPGVEVSLVKRVLGLQEKLSRYKQGMFSLMGRKSKNLGYCTLADQSMARHKSQMDIYSLLEIIARSHEILEPLVP